MKLSIRDLLWLAVLILAQPAVAAEPPPGDPADRSPKMQKLMEASLNWYELLPKADASAPLKPQVILSWRNTVRGEQAKDSILLAGVNPSGFAAAMQIDLWPIERVKPYHRNPRQNDRAVEAVAASLKEFGWRQPIVVDNDGVIIVGHTRWKAAQKLRLKKVPVHVATNLSPEQIQANRIADNQTATIAEWDYTLL